MKQEEQIFGRGEQIKDFFRISKEELQKVLLEKREKLRQLRFDLTAGKVKNVREIRKIRRDIARILTILKIKNQNLTEPNRAKEHV